jgi:protein arginine kinase
VRFERTWRERLLKENRRKLEDRIWRAWAVLRHGRWITSEETLEYLSFIRLGVHLGVLKGVDLATVNDLFVFSQPGHLQKAANRALEAEERDAARADWIRKRLGAE